MYAHIYYMKRQYIAYITATTCTSLITGKIVRAVVYIHCSPLHCADILENRLMFI